MAEPFTTRLGMMMHYHESDYPPKRLICCLQAQHHSVMDHIYKQNVTFSYIFRTADPFATKLDSMAHHHKLDCLVERLICFGQESKTQERLKIPVNVHLDYISSIDDPSVTQLAWLCIIMGQCHARRLVCCLQGHGHS